MITSLKNEKIKLIRSVMTNRRRRTQEGVFFIEGVHAVTAAYEEGWKIRWLIYDPATVQTGWAWQIIARTPPEARLEVSTYVLEQLSDRSSPSELLAIVVQRPDDLARLPVEEDLLMLLLDRPHNPGNLGSMIRSADALGAQGVIITGHAADIYDPKTVRASMGSLFVKSAVAVQRHEVLEAWLAEVRAKLGRLQVVATSAHVDTPLYEHDLTGPTILAIGNEAAGISSYFEALCDHLVTIPMSPEVATSLNASVAASIFLYEASRQRAQQKGYGKGERG
ncbi:MAG: rRNA methyltransferase [Anaerolineae bacterium]|nr:rRNA methyltransferase [Anaerolineae bacterium]